jgi:hypothetical protein
LQSEEDYDDDYEEEEEGYYVRREEGSEQVSLGEFLGNTAPTTETWITLSKQCLATLQNSTPENAIGALQSCQNVRENIMAIIETDGTLTDGVMAELLEQLEALNAVL